MSVPSKPFKVTFVYPLTGMVVVDGLARELTRLGYDLRIWSELSEDRYRRRKGLGAIWVRFRMWVLFPARSTVRCLFGRSPGREVYVVVNTPFYLPLLIRACAGNNGKVVHALWDLYPDQLVLARKLRPHSLVERLCAAITRASFEDCDATVFLGERLKAWAEKRYGTVSNGRVIEVGADGDALGAEPGPHAGPVRILYAGNFGYAHDVNTLRDCLNRQLAPGVELVFHASGAGYNRLTQQLRGRSISDRNVILKGPLSTGEWEEAMGSAQVALVTMRHGAENIVFPSKTYSAMVAGQAILAICPAASDLAVMIGKAECGWVVEPGDSEGFFRTLATIAGSPDVVLQKRRNARSYGRACFDMPGIALRWSDLIDELGMPPGGGRKTEPYVERRQTEAD